MSFDDALSKAKQLVELYEGIKGNTEIPKLLDDALNQRWELAADDAIADMMTIYHKDDQELDAQRLITLQKASQVLAELEDAFVATAVSNPAQVYLKQLRRAQSASQFVSDHAGGIWEGVKAIFKAVWAVIKADFDYTAPLQSLEAIWSAIVQLIADVLYFAATSISGAFFLGVLTTLDLPVFKQSFRKLVDNQKTAVKSAHDRALFQNQHAKRQRREKRTRS